MSIPRNCDRCGTTFAFKGENSGKFNGIIYRKYDSGEGYEEHKEWDFCPTCTGLMESPKVGKYDPARDAGDKLISIDTDGIYSMAPVVRYDFPSGEYIWR